MTIHTQSSCIAALLLAAAAFSLPALAGPTDPPPGPISSTHKTLSEVEPRTPISSIPFTITEPGSYYLTRHLTASPGAPGITIQASDVTLDLAGFTLSGVGGSAQGIRCPENRENITVTSGIVRDWPDTGVFLQNASRARVEGVSVLSNALTGLSVGPNSIISRCIADGNADGFTAYDGTTLENCTASNNADAGFDVTSACSLRACTANLNAGRGISAGKASVVADCTSYSNGGDGINVGNGAVVRACTSQVNNGNGIAGATAVTIVNCSASSNGLSGIRVNSNGLVLSNNCSGNATGIEAAGFQSRIEDNTATANQRGYHVTGTGNLIIRNAAIGNFTANYHIVAGNGVGVIVPFPVSPAIIGSSGGTGVGTTNPTANHSN